MFLKLSTSSILFLTLTLSQHTTLQGQAQASMPRPTETTSSDHGKQERTTKLQKLAYDFMQAGQFQKAEEVQRQILFQENAQQSRASTPVTRETLFLWLILLNEQKLSEATSFLRQSLDESARRASLCYSDFAHYLLGDISEDEFLALKTENEAWCVQYGEGRKDLAYFWIAQRHWLSGNREKAKTNLLQFIVQARPEDYREQGITNRQLETLSQAIPKRSKKKQNQCR